MFAQERCLRGRKGPPAKRLGGCKPASRVRIPPSPPVKNGETYLAKKILILSGSPKKNGNTVTLVEWFCEGARSKNAYLEVVHTAFLKYKSTGCTSCRSCQKSPDYVCKIKDDARPILARVPEFDVIVVATPLYFFSASAQLKVIFDRMFSLYKWDNDTGTFKTPLRSKTLILLASAYEDVGLDALEKPFRLTAEYTGMNFESLLIPNAGISGEIKKRTDIYKKAFSMGEKAAED